VKRIITTSLQVIVTVALLYLLLRDPDRRAQIWSTLLTADKRWFVAGLGAYGAVVLLGSLRWQMVMAVQSIKLPYWRVVQLFMIGAFFNLFMLGTVGGDVVKGVYLLRESVRQKATALLTILMDRLIGVTALIALSAVIVGAQHDVFLRSPETRTLFYVVVLVLAAVSGVLLFSFVVTAFGLANRLPEKFPARATLLELSHAYALYASQWKASLAAFAISIAAHLMSFFSFYLAARAFTDTLSWPNILTVMPIVNTITALPISLSGVGVREHLFEQLLGDLYGISTDVALLVSLTGFTIIALGSALGGAVFLAYKRGER
jgi:glycosyltransferase 2 family protein